MTVKITQKVYDGLEFVRQSGKLNMLDRHGVARMCYDHDYYDAAVWASENKGLYARLIFEGSEIVAPELIDKEEEEQNQ